MAYNNSYDLVTKFKSTGREIYEYIKTALNLVYFEDTEYDIIETSYDEQSSNPALKKSWLINFFHDDDEFTTVFNYDRCYIASTYVVKILYLEDSDNNIIKFYNCGTSRTKFCYNAISFIKHHIKEKEKEKLERIIQREDFLMLINSSIINYDDFSKADYQQVINEKSTSKKRNVLEDPMYSRELLQFL
jgi:hypothetical protein